MRLINLDKLLNDIHKTVKESNLVFHENEIMDCIENADIIDTDEDVEPVRHGCWILEKEPDGSPYCFHCSVCDGDFHYIGIKTAYDYCPNCGAKMDEVTK